MVLGRIRFLEDGLVEFQEGFSEVTLAFVLDLFDPLECLREPLVNV